MANSFGTIFRITTFGESHGPMIGVVIDGVESGFPIDENKIAAELSRRRPTEPGARIEKDDFLFVSGIFEGKTTGAPLTVLISNTDIRSEDYAELKDKFRPGHADWTYHIRYSNRDYRGGGRSSGRETAARVAAGAIAKQILDKYGVSFKSELSIPLEPHDGDSRGGYVTLCISGIPAGIGEPVFDKLDALLAHAIVSIGAVKGIEFGEGFNSALLYGSQNNDLMDGGSFLSNHSGGILGGLSTGQNLILRVAVKPTPSIGITGRHDECIAKRIAPVIEAMAAVTILDLIYLSRAR